MIIILVIVIGAVLGLWLFLNRDDWTFSSSMELNGKKIYDIHHKHVGKKP